jgi:hypothetical protein
MSGGSKSPHLPSRECSEIDYQGHQQKKDRQGKHKLKHCQPYRQDPIRRKPG